MLPEEQAANSRYFYELASARFGFSWDKVLRAQAFHFKGGQGAKTGTGGHLPGDKVRGKIAEVRNLPEGQPAVSPARFPEWTSVGHFRDFAAEVREKTGGIPIGFKLSAQHIEKDIDAALDVGVDYIILDGRGGGTGAAPLNLQRQHLRADDTRLGQGAAALGHKRWVRRNADHYRWLEAPSRFCQGYGPGRRRCCGVQRSHPGDRVLGDACLPHQQLSGRDRHAEATLARASARRYRGRTAGTVLLGRS